MLLLATLPLATASASSQTITGTVYTDVNGNGKIDIGDTGIANVKVDLYAMWGSTPLATTRTDSKGKYTFNRVPGTYVVMVTTPTGYLATTRTSAGVTTTASLAGTFNVGLAKPVTICGYTYWDKNKNMKWDTKEPGVSVVDISLKPTSGTTLWVNSGSNGYFSFTKLKPGTYRLQNNDPSWPCTTTWSKTVTVTSGQVLNVTKAYGMFGVVPYY